MLPELITKIMSVIGITTKKSDMVFTLEVLNKIVKEDLQEETISIVEFLKAGVGSRPVVEALAIINSTIKNEKDAIRYLQTNMEVIIELGDSVLELTMENFGKVMVKDSMSIKELNIYSLMETFNFLVGAHSDYIVFAIYASTNEEGYIYKKKDEWIRKILKEYRHTMQRFEKQSVKSLVKDIDALTDVIITENPGLLHELTSVKDRKLMVPRNNFDGNPLTTLGKWWVDIKLTRVDKLEYDVKLIKLKLNELRELSQNGGATVELSKQIEYYETKVITLDKEIIELLGE